MYIPRKYIFYAGTLAWLVKPRRTAISYELFIIFINQFHLFNYHLFSRDYKTVLKGSRYPSGERGLRGRLLRAGAAEQVKSARCPGGAGGGSRGLNPWLARETVNTKHFRACPQRLVGDRFGRTCGGSGGEGYVGVAAGARVVQAGCSRAGGGGQGGGRLRTALSHAPHPPTTHSPSSIQPSYGYIIFRKS